jgi:hypothetical protein
LKFSRIPFEFGNKSFVSGSDIDKERGPPARRSIVVSSAAEEEEEEEEEIIVSSTRNSRTGHNCQTIPDQNMHEKQIPWQICQNLHIYPPEK